MVDICHNRWNKHFCPSDISDLVLNVVQQALPTRYKVLIKNFAICISIVLLVKTNISLKKERKNIPWKCECGLRYEQANVVYKVVDQSMAILQS